MNRAMTTTIAFTAADAPILRAGAAALRGIDPDDIDSIPFEDEPAGYSGPDGLGMANGANSVVRPFQRGVHTVPDAPGAEPYLVPQVAGDFEDAPDLRRIGETLIRRYPEFFPLAGFEIRYLWKRKGGASSGRAVYGKAIKPSGLAGWAMGSPTWAIWLAADTVRLSAFTPLQVEALLYHEMCHLVVEEQEDEDGEMEPVPKLVGHDLEMFVAEVRRYGLWAAELKEAAPAFQQTALPGFAEGV